MMGIMGQLPDEDDPRSIVTRLLAALPPGSYLALCDGSDTNESLSEAIRVYKDVIRPEIPGSSPFWPLGAWPNMSPPFPPKGFCALPLPDADAGLFEWLSAIAAPAPMPAASAATATYTRTRPNRRCATSTSAASKSAAQPRSPSTAASRLADSRTVAAALESLRMLVRPLPRRLVTDVVVSHSRAGPYDLVFVQWRDGRPSRRREIRIVLNPRR